MSRIGKTPIKLNSSVNVSLGGGNNIVVRGPKGELSLSVDLSIGVKVVDEEVVLAKSEDTRRASALHGLYRSLIANMVVGVSEGYKKSLELVGVGYKADIKDSVIELALGYSHTIFFALPPEIKAKVEIGADKVYIIHLEGIDKQLIGQMAAKLKSLRKVEPYKGKGVRLVGEFVRRKAGKSGSKK
jgi:large subunit ribosomal protein L6